MRDQAVAHRSLTLSRSFNDGKMFRCSAPRRATSRFEPRDRAINPYEYLKFAAGYRLAAQKPDALAKLFHSATRRNNNACTDSHIKVRYRETTPRDLMIWVRAQNRSAESAAAQYRMPDLGRCASTQPIVSTVEGATPMDAKTERRQHARLGVEIHCKVRCPRTGRYHPAITTDLSSGGSLLTVQTPVPLGEGQRLEIALPQADSAVLRARDLIKATVVRSSAVLDRHQVVAICFDEPRSLAAPSTRTAAA
jgi:hypothetical protein